MTYLDPMRIVLSGDKARAQKHVRAARVLAYALTRANGASGATAGKKQLRMGDGTVIEVEQAGLEMHAKIHAPPPGGVVEVVGCFIRSAEGLRLLNFETKDTLKVFGGLEAFEADDADSTARYVYLTGGALAVRADTKEVTAFGTAYTVAVVGGGTGRAWPRRARLSPDQDYLAIAFDQTTDPDTSAVLDAIGGMLIVDAETLTPVRPAIRMGFRPFAFAWAKGEDDDPDRLFLGTSLNVDAGDSPSGSVATSIHDYVSEFDADGNLIGSLLIHTWALTPNAGFFRTIDYLLANKTGTRLYALVADEVLTGNASRVFVIDIEDGGMATETIIDLDIRGFSLELSHDGSKLFIHGETVPGGDPVIQEYDLSEPTPELAYSAENAEFAANTQTPSLGGIRLRPLQRGVESRVGAAPDPNKFLFSTNPQDTIRAYSKFDDDEPRFEYDISDLDVGDRYVLVNIGTRAQGAQA